eukprot:2715254-Amphidinium_carterae.1
MHLHLRWHRSAFAPSPFGAPASVSAPSPFGAPASASTPSSVGAPVVSAPSPFGAPVTLAPSPGDGDGRPVGPDGHQPTTTAAWW